MAMSWRIQAKELVGLRERPCGRCLKTRWESEWEGLTKLLEARDAGPNDLGECTAGPGRYRPLAQGLSARLLEGRERIAGQR